MNPHQQISRRASITNNAFRDASAPSAKQDFLEKKLLSNRPLCERFSDEDLKALKDQFTQMARKKDHVIDTEFVQSLGVLGINNFALCLYRAFDFDKSGLIESNDFMYSNAWLMRGTESERLKCRFNDNFIYHCSCI